MFTISKFTKIFNNLVSTSKIFVAFSGGLDSQVLLHVCKKFCDQKSLSGKKIELTAVHVNHGLSSNAEKWSQKCQKVCDSYNIPLIIKKVNAKLPAKSGLSQEEVARNLRYKAFAKILPKGAILVTAHHQNDQAETLLLQLMRGAGVKGLSAMSETSKFATGSLVRPLLNFTRQELHDYAKKYHLTWIEDESNLSAAFDRNFLRLKVLPLLFKRWPGMFTTLTRSANHLAEADFLLDELAKLDLKRVKGEVVNTLSVVKILKLDPAAQRNLLRYWLSELGLPIPSSKKIEQIQETVLRSRSDASPLVSWRGAEIRRFAGEVYAFSPLTKHDAKQVLDWDLKKPLALPAGLGVLKAKLVSQNKTNIPSQVTVRFRRGGEKIKISGQKTTKTLKNLFQVWRIPTWQRDRIPLVYFDSKLVAIVGFVKSKEGEAWDFWIS